MHETMDNKGKIRLLLVEDETDLAGIISDTLSEKGFEVRCAGNGADGLRAVTDFRPEIVVTDIMMPVKDGFSLAKDIRKLDSRIPILFLTAKTLEADRLKGFQMGGDDYLTKPFSMDELLLRIQAILRRTGGLGREQEQHIFVLGDTKFDFLTQKLSNLDGTKTVDLTSRESELLRLLCMHGNEVVERKDALVKVWKSDNYFNARSMDVYVTKLRKALRTVGSLEIINVHGVGFKLVVEK